MHIAFIHQKKGQYPKRALSISTLLLNCPVSPIPNCVNALNGLIPFLHLNLKQRYRKEAICVNALNGLFPFLLNFKSKPKFPATNECQCPKRAFPISTAASGSPHKHWLPRHIFAGICLNILISPVFIHFLACSQFVHISPAQIPLTMKHQTANADKAAPHMRHLLSRPYVPVSSLRSRAKREFPF